MSIPSANDLYKACKTIIKTGQPVFPCYSTNEGNHRAKAPMTRKGLYDATLDINKVKRWWRNHGEAAIGIPTGIKWDVLDVDTKHGSDGRVHLPRLIRHGLLNGCQRLVRTPSGGWHLYFEATPGARNKSRATLGLDVRGTGGYVLAPPSWIDDDDESIGTYDWWDSPTDSTSEPLLWDLIVNTLAPVDSDNNKPIPLPRIERQASLAGLKSWLMDREHGERNNALHWAVRRCIDGNIDPNELEEVAINIGLDEVEIRTTIDGAIKRTGADTSELLTEVEAQFGRD